MDHLGIHGTTVARAGAGLLILGPSGSGKSTLGLALMALGADLVADDRTVLRREGDAVLADAPDALRGRIEARHIGLLRADPVGPVALKLVVELGDDLPPRLPDAAVREVLGVRLPLVVTRAAPALAPALWQYLIGGRVA